MQQYIGTGRIGASGNAAYTGTAGTYGPISSETYKVRVLVTTDAFVTTDGTTQTTTTESSGVVTEFTPGTVFVLKTEAAEPVHYKFAKTVTYVTADGHVIEASRIKKDSKVHVHYVRDNDDMLVDRIVVDQD